MSDRSRRDPSGVLTLFVCPGTECAPPSMWWATPLVLGSWTTCRRRSSLSLMLQRWKFSPLRRSWISSPRPQSSQKWTWLTPSSRQSYPLAPLDRSNRTIMATPSPNPIPSLTHHLALSDHLRHVPSVLLHRGQFAPIPLGLSVLSHPAFFTGLSPATVPSPAMTTRYVCQADVMFSEEIQKDQVEHLHLLQSGQPVRAPKALTVFSLASSLTCAHAGQIKVNLFSVPGLHHSSLLQRERA